MILQKLLDFHLLFILFNVKNVEPSFSFSKGSEISHCAERNEQPFSFTGCHFQILKFMCMSIIIYFLNYSYIYLVN